MSRGMIDTISDNMTTMSISKVRYDEFVIAHKKLSDLEDLIQDRAMRDAGISALEVKLLYDLMIKAPAQENREICSDKEVEE